MKSIIYKDYQIQLKEASHCALIYKNGELVKCIAGNIFNDGTNDRISKAKLFIDKIAA